MRIFSAFTAAILAPVLATAALAAPGLVSADVSRSSNGSYILQWRTSQPAMRVAIYAQGEDGKARQLIEDDGLAPSFARLTMPASTAKMSNFYLVVDGGRDDLKEDGKVAHDRVVPLEHASNFRDLGGYMSEDGRVVRWGKIYRSGAPVMLTGKDLAYLEKLNIRTSVDLRSNEERKITPSQMDTPQRKYLTLDYSMMELLPLDKSGEITMPKTGGYGDSIVKLAPLYRSLFKALLEDNGALQYNCSAGQDRTGIASALILSALGVSRDQILRDYQLSADLRRPQYEMRRLDPEEYPDNKVAQLLAAAYESGTGKPEPLYGADGVSILAATFGMIDRKWGSVDAFLHKEIGLSDKDFQRLQELYLE